MPASTPPRRRKKRRGGGPSDRPVAWRTLEKAHHRGRRRGQSDRCGIAEGQRSDAPPVLPVPAQATRIVGRFDEVPGDGGFDSDEIRPGCLDDIDALPVIPDRARRVIRRPWDEVMREIYQQMRNQVERLFCKAKRSRRSATRYEKLGGIFLGLVQLSFGFIHIKKVALSVNTP